MKPDHDEHSHKLLKALNQPNIGLDSDVHHLVVEILNHCLANEVVLSQKTRSGQWNVSGAGSFELHTLFESHYKQLNDISDEIAQRARMMGGTAIGSLQEMIDYSQVQEIAGVVPDVSHLLADYEASIRFLREDAKKCSDEYADEATRDFLVDILRQHEKMAWMLRSHLDTRPC